MWVDPERRPLVYVRDLPAFSTAPAACAQAMAWARQRGFRYEIAWNGEAHSVTVWDSSYGDSGELSSKLHKVFPRAFAEALLDAIWVQKEK